ncbi:hypothetical protein KKR91_08970 [Arthrobacter jiangjiafuii]|uniref:Uncharacterized protein n=1 Tax=Arthrobacter jiangjiafuii TaxID=2817475 RepID=A0A975QZN8_9MICC|nr:hypothetical protein [Arthrobacter jiangjiafuii]MBP3043132.1 hypothetical protein [Arthrobacter jiangjiafuii]QWC08688.1 hypothetical protein KKR91_08970 [Arthrobacter jiangjiafuii]
MPWWSWILIWSALVVAAAAFFALVGWRLFRRFMAVLREAETAMSALNIQAPAPGASEVVRTAPEPAIFEDPILVRTRYEEGKEERKAARRERRVRRRTASGQPRALRDFPDL